MTFDEADDILGRIVQQGMPLDIDDYEHLIFMAQNAVEALQTWIYNAKEVVRLTT